MVYDGPAADTVNAYIASVQKLIDAQPLEQRTDREGGDAFRFRSVDFCDAATGAPQNILMSGQPVRIEVGYVCPAATALNDVVVAISFNNSSGAFLSACRSDAVGRVFRLNPGRGHLTCRIPKFPFSQ